MKFNLIYFYTSSCQFKEQQQSSHLCLISSIHCRWSREHGFWTEAEHVARSQRPPPLPRPHGPSVQVGVSWLRGSRGARHLGTWAKLVANEENPAVSSQDTAAPLTFRLRSPALFHRLLSVVNGQFSPAEQVGKLSLGGLSPPRSHSRETDSNPGLLHSEPMFSVSPAAS